MAALQLATLSRKTFTRLALLLIALAILRSAITTRLDSFTIDEAYHIAAGVSYIKYHDFRINPEHPPLIKIVVGNVMRATGFHLGPLQQFSDKGGERSYTERAVFRQNDPDSIQRRARTAMYLFNGLLLLALAFALERTFNGVVALGTLLFLAIDPTVAAHMPVVMTDLPIALLSTIAVVLAARAFRDWLWTDLAACSVFLGLALAAKHSAPIVFLSIALIGATLAVFSPFESPSQSRLPKFGKLAALLAGSMLVLWGFYLFQYFESPSRIESFNRPLAAKISDVASPRYQAVLKVMDATRVVPRAYLWGFADTIRAGMEGREIPQLFFGKTYHYRCPKYFFPAMIAVKVPIGLLALILLGLILFAAWRIPARWNFPAAVVLAVAVLFLLVLSRGATYAGIRHALPVVVMLSVFAGIALDVAFSGKSRQLKVLATIALNFAAVSALPQIRPWEYFNEFIGGTSSAYKYFSDEGVDLGQRTKELVAYYKRELKPNGLRPDCLYDFSEDEHDARGINCFGSDKVKDAPLIALPERSGTIFISPQRLLPNSYWDRAALRESTLLTRFGNLLVYRGTFHLPGQAAAAMYWRGLDKIYGDKPDDAEAEKDFLRSIELDPGAFFVHMELGNLYLKRGSREQSLHAYSDALKYSPDESELRSALQTQLQHLERDPLGSIPPLRDPAVE